MRVGLSGWFWAFPDVGSGQYLHALARALAEVAPANTYILYLPRVHVRHPPALPGLEVQVISTPFDGFSENLAKLWFEQVALPRAASRDGVDVLHVPYWGPPLFSRVPTVVTVHDLIPMVLPEYRAPLRVRAYNLLAAAATRRARLVLADSDASRRDICRHLGLPEARVQVVPLGVDARYRRVTDPVRLARVREKYKLPPRFFLYLGGFDVRKNLGTLIAAYALVLQQLGASAPQEESEGWPPFLVVAGKLPGEHTAFHPHPRVLAEAHGVLPYVHFPGWVTEEDKPALYTLADVFVFPSRYEGFGLPVLEALACGTPVIASDASSLPEVVGDAGILVPPDDVPALAAAMLRLIQNPALREEFSRRAEARSRTFSWTATALKTLEAYRVAAT